MTPTEPRSLKVLADLIGARLQGDPDCLIYGIASLENAKQGQLSFLSNQQYKKYLASTHASAVILSPEDAKGCPVHSLISDNPRLSLVKVVKLFAKTAKPSGKIHPTAIVGENCVIPASVSIGPYVVIGNGVVMGDQVVVEAGCAIGDDCRIGNDTTLKARVTLYSKVQIGERTLIHSGTVIGSDGFGFANQAGNWIKMPHIGGVWIGDDVEIGANTTIDRGFLEDTTIGNGVIIDNLVQIGHNVSIGARTAIAGCVGIAGSTTIGEGCLIGGASCIAGHIQIADQVHITATSAVNHSIEEKGVYASGLPAKPVQVWRKNVARFNFLDNMAKRLRALEKAVASQGSELSMTEEK